MKTYLSKCICFASVILFLGCSNEDNEISNENVVNRIETSDLFKKSTVHRTKNKSNVNHERRSPMHIIYAECNQATGSPTTIGPTALNSCFLVLDENFTIYNYLQSDTCLGIYMLWVDAQEYYDFMGEAHIPGTTRHLLRPPYSGDIPPAYDYYEYDDYSVCF